MAQEPWQMSFGAPTASAPAPQPAASAPPTGNEEPWQMSFAQPVNDSAATKLLSPVEIGLANTPGISQIGAGLYAAYEKVAPQSMGGAPSNMSYNDLYHQAQNFQQQALAKSKDESPISTGAGQILGATSEGVLGGGAVDAVLPEVTATGFTGGALNTGRAAVVGAGAGAASTPTQPVQGAETGAITGGTITAAGNALRVPLTSLISSFANKSGAAASEIAQTGDTLAKNTPIGLDANGEPIHPPGPNTATAFSNPNLLGLQSIKKVPVIGGALFKLLSGSADTRYAAQQNISGQLAPFTASRFIEGAELPAAAPNNPTYLAAKQNLFDLTKQYQAAKAAGQDVSALTPKLKQAQVAYKVAIRDITNAAGYNPTNTWQETLKNEPFFKDAPLGTDPGEPPTGLTSDGSPYVGPNRFQQAYPNLTQKGKNALIAGYLDTSLDNNGSNLKGIANDIGNILGQTGNKAFAQGEDKMTLVGLQKYLQATHSDTPIDILASGEGGQTSAAGKVLQSVAPRIGGTMGKALTAIAAGGEAESLGESGASGALHLAGGVGHLGVLGAKARIAFLVGNWATNKAPVRNALIDLAEAKTPASIAKAYGNINSIASSGAAQFLNQQQ